MREERNPAKKTIAASSQLLMNHPSSFLVLMVPYGNLKRFCPNLSLSSYLYPRTPIFRKQLPHQPLFLSHEKIQLVMLCRTGKKQRTPEDVAILEKQWMK